MTSSRSDDTSIEKGKWAAVRRRDRELVDGCRRGDEDAWVEVWTRYGPLIRSTARRCGCDDDEIGEVLQRVGLVAVEGLHKLDDGARLGGWLASVARFQSLDLRRQRRPTDELFEATATIEPGHDEELLRTEVATRIRQALLAVDERCQRLIRRLDLKEPADTYAEVAADEDLAPTSIGPIRRRCLERLRKNLEKVSR